MAYFDINDESKQTESNLLSSLVLTFTAVSKRYALLDCLYEKYYRIHTPTNFDLLDVLKELVIGCKKSYIVIDALDECAVHGKLFEVINAIHGWQISSFHLLVTSRSEQRINLWQRCRNILHKKYIFLQILLEVISYPTSILLLGMNVNSTDGTLILKHISRPH